MKYTPLDWRERGGWALSITKQQCYSAALFRNQISASPRNKLLRAHVVIVCAWIKLFPVIEMISCALNHFECTQLFRALLLNYICLFLTCSFNNTPTHAFYFILYQFLVLKFKHAVLVLEILGGLWFFNGAKFVFGSLEDRIFFLNTFGQEITRPTPCTDTESK